MSENTELDELAQIYVDELARGHGMYSRPKQGQNAAAAILAAGYRKPHQVTSVEEVRLLPSDTVLLSDEGGVFQMVFGLWKEIGFRDSMRADDIALPATVLYHPDEAAL